MSTMLSTVLFVCEGNVCRSPYAMVAFRERWRASGAPVLDVTSAGTRAPIGAGAHELLRPLVPHPVGADELDQHQARRITPALLRGQDLVVTMERSHRADVLDAAPNLLRRTFTLVELERFARAVLAEGIPSGADLQQLIARHRLRMSTGSAADDVADPVVGGPEDFRSMVERIDDALSVIVPVLVDLTTPYAAPGGTR